MPPLPDSEGPTAETLWQYIEALRNEQGEAHTFFATTSGDLRDLGDFASLIPVADAIQEALKQREPGPSGQARARARLEEVTRGDQSPARRAATKLRSLSIRGAHWIWSGTTAACLAALAILCWTQVTGGPVTTLHVQAMIADHEEFVHDSSKVTFRSNEPARVAIWLRNRIGYEVTPVDLSLAGAHLIGGRRCTLEGIPIAFFMYKAGGTPVSLYELAAGRCRMPGLIQHVQDGHRFLDGTDGMYRVVAWRSNARVYILVSSMPGDRLMEVARHGAGDTQTDKRGDTL